MHAEDLWLGVEWQVVDVVNVRLVRGVGVGGDGRVEAWVGVTGVGDLGGGDGE